MGESRLSLPALRCRMKAAMPEDAAEYEMFDPADPAQAGRLLQAFGLRVQAPAGNAIHVHRDARKVLSETPVRMQGVGNALAVDRDCGFHGQIDMAGDGNLAVFRGGQTHLAIAATMYGGDTLLWHRAAFSWGIRVWIQGGTTLSVGEDCLFSENITIRTTDHHSMFDMETGAQINRPADVTIGRHVWVGQDCAIGKGAVIGDGAIIGARSLVIGEVGPAQLWAGSPARLLRDRVSWVHSHPRMDERERDRVINWLMRT
jgi:hypothetical protein